MTWVQIPVGACETRAKRVSRESERWNREQGAFAIGFKSLSEYLSTDHCQHSCHTMENPNGTQNMDSQYLSWDRRKFE